MVFAELVQRISANKRATFVRQIRLIIVEDLRTSVEHCSAPMCCDIVFLLVNH